jgi:hypothetical protein
MNEERSILCMSFLTAISDWQLFILVVGGPVIVMALGTLLVHRLLKNRKPHTMSDLHRATFSSLSTILAFLLGFLIVTAWTNYRDANEAVSQEATAITTLARDAQTLPSPAKQFAFSHLRRYTELVMTDEWPLMAKGNGSASPLALAEFNDLWSICSGKVAISASCGSIQGDLDRLSGQRALRLLSSQGGLPGALWVVLIVCAGAMGLVSLLFTTREIPLHQQILMRAILTTSFATLFWLIIILANPYAGGISVTTHAFNYPLLVLQTLST